MRLRRFRNYLNGIQHADQSSLHFRLFTSQVLIAETLLKYSMGPEFLDFALQANAGRKLLVADAPRCVNAKAMAAALHIISEHHILRSRLAGEV